jgi:hypothetical protein
MTTDPEADLRREFDAASRPLGLHFSPESILRQGAQTVRRRRNIAVGSVAMAVAVVATGANLLSRPHDTAAPQPANHTAKAGIVRAGMELNSGTSFQFELNLDPMVTSNLKLFISFKNRQHQQLGAWSLARPGQKPDAIWKSGMWEGHPYTVGLVPGVGAGVTLAGAASYEIMSDETTIPGYTTFAVEYKNWREKEAARPANIAAIAWSGPTGVVDGVEGDHRLTGQIVTIDRSVSVQVALRPTEAGRPTVFGAARLHTSSGSYATPLSAPTTDASGAAVMTGGYPLARRIPTGERNGLHITDNGPPIAAGILPSGASDIGVNLTSGAAMTGIAKSEPLPDGRVAFAVNASFGKSDPSKDSVNAITWTNSDGSRSRLKVIQKRRP